MYLVFVKDDFVCLCVFDYWYFFGNGKVGCVFVNEECGDIVFWVFFRVCDCYGNVLVGMGYIVDLDFCIIDDLVIVIFDCLCLYVCGIFFSVWFGDNYGRVSFFFGIGIKIFVVLIFVCDC